LFSFMRCSTFSRRLFATFSPETALTFDDVLLSPNLSAVASRKQVSLKTRLSRNIALNNPM
jgi:IMP dehydrogenase/GMP reductase